ncbi:hypothetical protein [Acinetobacter boissieri]|uniref:Uncharacterized protein n=1 Tax=Acinetobacter boissieri TaxID=1219383 RepID=A0A1G6HXS9_9GAMM|nr:hypothetical protein [Acinetobacter boissieri]SDB99082.1 hypothetical protein SAMN05421733_107108 [Acinetobacter boissieri]
MNYIRTAEAITALQNRDRILSVKQRQLLILISSKDFNKFSDDAKQRMYSSDIFDSLIRLGFVKQNLPSKQDHDESSQLDTFVQDTVTTPAQTAKEAPTQQNEVQSVPMQATETPVQSVTEPSYEQYQQIELTFDNMKHLLITTLGKYCGLMSRAHTKKIEMAQTVAELKRSHMTVITLLQESRMSQTELLQFTKALQRFYQQSL